MNFKNISAWSIRNPIPPLVMFFGLTCLSSEHLAQIAALISGARASSWG